MATLLELTSQGDVGTMSDESKLANVKLMSPQQLYELWERQNWRVHEIDFTQDRRDWEAMDPRTREEISWGLANFFVARSAWRRSSRARDAYATSPRRPSQTHRSRGPPRPHFTASTSSPRLRRSSGPPDLPGCHEHSCALLRALVEANQRLIS